MNKKKIASKKPAVSKNRMAETPIKIKKSKGGSLVRKTPETPKVESRIFNTKGRFLLFLLIVLTISAGSIVNFLFINKRVAFMDIAPKQAVVFSVIDQKTLYKQVSPFYEFAKEPYSYGYSFIAKINDYLKEAGLDFKRDIQPIFEDKAGFIIMPSNADTPVPCILILEKKFSLGGGKSGEMIKKIGQVLKKDYGFSVIDYRQVEISSFKHLRILKQGTPGAYFFAEADDYVVLSNSQLAIEEIIGEIIDN